MICRIWYVDHPKQQGIKWWWNFLLRKSHWTFHGKHVMMELFNAKKWKYDSIYSGIINEQFDGNWWCKWIWVRLNMHNKCINVSCIITDHIFCRKFCPKKVKINQFVWYWLMHHPNAKFESDLINFVQNNNKQAIVYKTRLLFASSFCKWWCTNHHFCIQIFATFVIVVYPILEPLNG